MKCWSLFIFSLFLTWMAKGQDLADSLDHKLPADSILTGPQSPHVRADSIPTDLLKVGTDSSMINIPLSDSTSAAVQDSLSIEKDTMTVNPSRFLTPQLYVDYGKLLSSIAGFDKKYEGAVSLLFYEKFEVVGEIGTAILQPEYAYVNGNYESSGYYYRIGGNIMSKLDGKASIGLGLRYGVSKFQDEGRIEILSASGLQDDFVLPFARNNLTARWWSAVLVSETRIALNKENAESKLNHLLKAGFFIRMRFLVSYDNDGDPLDVYGIPGYGQANNTQQAAFNLFVKFSF